MSQKQDFLSLVINFYWICSIMKIYIICCVPGQVSYLGKFLFLRYGPKCSQPIAGGFLIKKLTLSQEWIHGMNWFFACWFEFRKAKSYFTDFWVYSVKNGHGSLLYQILKILYLKNEWMNWADFLHAYCHAIIFG